MSFTASSGDAAATAGDALPLEGPVTIRVDLQGPETAIIDLFKDGSRLETVTGTRLELSADATAAVYRAEVALPGAPGEPPVPWVVSNPIYVGRAPGTVPRSATRPEASAYAVRYADGPASDWTIETSESSLGALDVVSAGDGGTQLSLRYGLGGTTAASSFVALVMPAGTAITEHDRMMFTAWGNRPMRISVQLRAPEGPEDQRWGRSVYLDTSPRTVTVYFDDLTPVGAYLPVLPVLDEVADVLFVVETVNTPVGSSGTLWIDDVRYGR